MLSPYESEFNISQKVCNDFGIDQRDVEPVGRVSDEGDMGEYYRRAGFIGLE